MSNLLPMHYSTVNTCKRKQKKKSVSMTEAEHKHAKFLKKMGGKFRDLEWCGEFRQTGMIAAVELVRNKKSKDTFSPKERVGHKIYIEGLKRGVFMRPLGNVIYFIPPLIIKNREIETMVETAYESIKAVLG